MTDNRPANPLEMIAYVLSQQIQDGEVVYIGTGLPMVAGRPVPIYTSSPS